MVTFSFGWGEKGPADWSGGQTPEGTSPPRIRLVSGESWDEVQRTGNNWHLPVRIRYPIVGDVFVSPSHSFSGSWRDGKGIVSLTVLSGAGWDGLLWKHMGHLNHDSI